MAGEHNPLSRKDNTIQAPSSNQRRFQRFGVKLACRVKPRGSRKTAVLSEEGETTDVSGGGLFFSTSVEWTLGTAIEFELDLPAHAVQSPVKIRCQGTITRLIPQGNGRMGIGATIDYYKISRLQKAIRQ